mmetsp:Transcript_4944/g.10446  ORF Transcript_4944/g.10446 Transcript_4944/m.10446 type:complete len:627 (-) Transcript_4944:720-2600(-)
MHPGGRHGNGKDRAGGGAARGAGEKGGERGGPPGAPGKREGDPEAPAEHSRRSGGRGETTGEEGVAGEKEGGPSAADPPGRAVQCDTELDAGAEDLGPLRGGDLPGGGGAAADRRRRPGRGGGGRGRQQRPLHAGCGLCAAADGPLEGRGGGRVPRVQEPEGKRLRLSPGAGDGVRVSHRGTDGDAHAEQARGSVGIGKFGTAEPLWRLAGFQRKYCGSPENVKNKRCIGIRHFNREEKTGAACKSFGEGVPVEKEGDGTERHADGEGREGPVCRPEPAAGGPLPAHPDASGLRAPDHGERSVRLRGKQGLLRQLLRAVGGRGTAAVLPAPQDRNRPAEGVLPQSALGARRRRRHAGDRPARRPLAEAAPGRGGMHPVSALHHVSRAAQAPQAVLARVPPAGGAGGIGGARVRHGRDTAGATGPLSGGVPPEKRRHYGRPRRALRKNGRPCQNSARILCEAGSRPHIFVLHGHIDTDRKFREGQLLIPAAGWPDPDEEAAGAGGRVPGGENISVPDFDKGGGSGAQPDRSEQGDHLRRLLEPHERRAGPGQGLPHRTGEGRGGDTPRGEGHAGGAGVRPAAVQDTADETDARDGHGHGRHDAYVPGDRGQQREEGRAFWTGESVEI